MLIKYRDYTAPNVKWVMLKETQMVLAVSTGSATTGDIDSDENLDDNPFGL